MTDLFGLPDGQIPVELPSDCESCEELQQLIDSLAAITRFARAMADGDLSATLDKRGPLAGTLKALHANLRHLTWQTKEVAAGDFTQRVDFLGDFSVAFNHMVESLAHARDSLTKKNQELSESETRFRNFFENNSLTMLLVDPVTEVIIDANAVAVTYYGYPREELINMPVGNISVMAPEQVVETWQCALREGRNYFPVSNRLASDRKSVV